MEKQERHGAQGQKMGKNFLFEHHFLPICSTVLLPEKSGMWGHSYRKEESRVRWPGKEGTTTRITSLLHA